MADGAQMVSQDLRDPLETALRAGGAEQGERWVGGSDGGGEHSAEHHRFI